MNTNRKICPGCGTNNAKSQFLSYFCCRTCGWESDRLPTVQQIIESDFRKCNDVNLSAFLRTLFRPERAKKQAKTRADT